MSELQRLGWSACAATAWVMACALSVAGCSSESGAAGNGGAAGAAGSGGAGGSGATAGAAGSGGAAGSAGAAAYPERLSQTGLYSEITTETLASGVAAFAPRFPLWSDNASKRRWVSLPEGGVIDNTDPDFWVYPVGTKLWKEFTSGGTRVETRLLEKTAQGWTMIAYLWQPDQLDAVAVPDGAMDALGTTHDVPTAAQCGQCHNNLPDRVLGFTGIQLAHAETEVSLEGLGDAGRLSVPNVAAPVVPGDGVAQAALGYLHANCGMCHNPRSSTFFRVDMELWLTQANLDSVEGTRTYQTTVGVAPFEGIPPGATARIAPGDPQHSALVGRMRSRETSVSMPPVGTEVVDDAGVQAVEAWISSLQ